IFDIAKVPSTSFPTFDNLVRLEVDYIYSPAPISSLINFLHFSPNLESLIINQ
ncbi:hypothetical protein MKW94_017640, partial [Papaver nudicaule]|nr:hypothetical protein [Papaver nudicaule]